MGQKVNPCLLYTSKKAAKAAGEKSIEMLHLKDLTKVTGYIRGGCTSYPIPTL